MSYANGTTHYNLPLTVGTDKRDWSDTNQAFSDVDAALHTAAESASTTASGLSTLDNQINGTGGIDSRVTDNTTNIGLVEGRVTTLEGSVTGLGTDISDVRRDVEDMISAYNEPTATSTHAYSENDYFIYNDVLYKATTSIAIGDTIVPNTNCSATNVSSELAAIQGGGVVSAADVSYNNTSSGLVATDVQDAIDEVNTSLSELSENVLTMEKVWENSDPTVAFTSTEISIANISNYKYLKILCLLGTDRTNMINTNDIFIIEKTQRVDCGWDASVSRFRNFTPDIANNKITVSSGYNTDNTTSNTVAIPYIIYGVK